MKKMILFIVLLLVLVACVPAEATTIKTAQNPMVYGVTRIYDKEAGVFCWIMKTTYGVAIDCIPSSELPIILK